MSDRHGKVTPLNHSIMLRDSRIVEVLPDQSGNPQEWAALIPEGYSHEDGSVKLCLLGAGANGYGKIGIIPPGAQPVKPLLFNNGSGQGQELVCNLDELNAIAASNNAQETTLGVFGSRVNCIVGGVINTVGRAFNLSDETTQRLQDNRLPITAVAGLAGIFVLGRLLGGGGRGVDKALHNYQRVSEIPDDLLKKFHKMEATLGGILSTIEGFKNLLPNQEQTATR